LRKIQKKTLYNRHRTDEKCTNIIFLIIFSFFPKEIHTFTENRNLPKILEESRRNLNLKSIMAYKIDQIEGVGAAYAEKLIAAGVKTTENLLEKCAKPAGRKKLAEETGISEKLILKWTNHADLFRINGIAGQFAELLEAAGVDTVKEFRNRVAANLQPKMEEVNAAKNLCNRVPSVTELEKMIAQAKELEPIITY